MTGGQAALIEVNVDLERLRHVVEVLGCAVGSGDLLTARYAAAEITCTGERIETALLAADTAARALTRARLSAAARG